MKNMFISLLVLSLVWVSKDFIFLRYSIEFMNSLPEKDKERAYIVPLRIDRGIPFWAGYSVIYPKEI